jgi:hypothetical protein
MLSLRKWFKCRSLRRECSKLALIIFRLRETLWKASISKEEADELREMLSARREEYQEKAHQLNELQPSRPVQPYI